MRATICFLAVTAALGALACGASSSHVSDGDGGVIDGGVDGGVVDGGACTPDPPDVVISGTGGGQEGAPYCPWSGCLDGPKASCGQDGQWHCPAPPAPCCYRPNTTELVPCPDDASTD